MGELTGWQHVPKNAGSRIASETWLSWLQCFQNFQTSEQHSSPKYNTKLIIIINRIFIWGPSLSRCSPIRPQITIYQIQWAIHKLGYPWWYGSPPCHTGLRRPPALQSYKPRQLVYNPKTVNIPPPIDWSCSCQGARLFWIAMLIFCHFSRLSCDHLKSLPCCQGTPYWWSYSDK